MQLQQRFNAFSKLGQFLGDLASDSTSDVIHKASLHNGWFTQDNIRYALQNWSEALSVESLERWISKYDIKESEAKTIGIVMAGNIPLVGFHDFISALITGNKVLAKLSSNDGVLLPYISDKLTEIEPGFADRIAFAEDKLQNFDAVIATGSNNTARYFEYYFGKYPNIIRKNRNSVAVLNGSESIEQLEALADDIFRYYGLGCRNVSKIFLPKDYDFENFFKAMFSWKDIINETRYMNNYDYNKAVYLMSNIPLLDNEFMLLKEDKGYASPISVVYYEYYSVQSRLLARIQTDIAQIQTITGSLNGMNTLDFGQAQQPQLWDYADGVDTVDFLLKLS